MTKQFWGQLCETERNLLKLEAIDPNPFQPEVSRLLVKVQFEMRMASKTWQKPISAREKDERISAQRELHHCSS